MRPLIAEPPLQQFWDFWDGLRGTRAMPARHDFVAEDIPPALLGRIVLFDVLRPGPRLRYRLYGAMLADWYGRDRTGHLLPLPEETPYPDLVRALVQVAVDGRPMYRVDRFVGSDKRVGAMARLTLPLSADGQTIDMLIGAAERL